MTGIHNLGLDLRFEHEGRRERSNKEDVDEEAHIIRVSIEAGTAALDNALRALRSCVVAASVKHEENC